MEARRVCKKIDACLASAFCGVTRLAELGKTVSAYLPMVAAADRRLVSDLVPHLPSSDMDALLELGFVDKLLEGRMDVDALSLLSDLSRNSASRSYAICKEGGLPRITYLLSSDLKTAEMAADLLGGMSMYSEVCKAWIAEGDAISLALPLLCHADSEAAVSAACLLGNLARNDPHTAHRMWKGGAVQKLSSLLRSGRSAAEYASYAINHICKGCKHRSESAASCIQPMVGWMRVRSVHGRCSAALTSILRSDPDSAPHVLSACMSTGFSLVGHLPRVIHILKQEAETRLLSSQTAASLEEAMSKAELVGVEVSHAKERLDRMRAERGKWGLADLPNEFHCPISLCRMRDPVVASDGHSYERHCIQKVILMDAKSPMTRESLSRVLVPNHALKSRMRQHESDMDALAERVEEHVRKRMRA